MQTHLIAAYSKQLQLDSYFVCALVRLVNNEATAAPITGRVKDRLARRMGERDCSFCYNSVS